MGKYYRDYHTNRIKRAAASAALEREKNQIQLVAIGFERIIVFLVIQLMRGIIQQILGLFVFAKTDTYFFIAIFLGDTIDAKITRF